MAAAIADACLAYRAALAERLQEEVPFLPGPPCAPAIGVHTAGCQCQRTLRISDVGPIA